MADDSTSSSAMLAQETRSVCLSGTASPDAKAVLRGRFAVLGGSIGNFSISPLYAGAAVLAVTAPVQSGPRATMSGEAAMMSAFRDWQSVGRLALTISSLLLLAALTVASAERTASAAGGSWTQQNSQRQKLSGVQAQQVRAVSQRLSSQSDAILRKYGVRRGTCSNASLSRLRVMGGELDRAFASARSQLSKVLSASQLKQFTATYQERRRAERARIVCTSRRNQ